MRPNLALIERLEELEKAELVRREVDFEPTFMFRHALTQEAAYQSLLKVTRAELHRRVANVIEQLGPDQLDANAAILELHYEGAGLHDKAFDYAVRAGDKAARAFANVEALFFYDRALDLASTFLASENEHELTTRLSPVYVHRGRILEIMGDHPAAVENYRAMIERAQRTGDAAMEADGLNHLVTARVVLTGPTPETDQQLERALALARRAGDPELTARALWNNGLTYRLIDPQRAADAFEQALVLAETGNLRQVAAFVRMDLSLALVLLGRPRQARDYLQQALEEFRILDLKPMMADALGTMAYHAYTRGETFAARAFAEEGLEISQTIANPWGVLYHQMLYFFLLELDRGNLERVFQESESYLARARQFDYPYFKVMHHTILTRAYLELDQADRAQGWSDELGTTFGMGEESALSLWARWLQANVILERGEVERAHALLTPLMQASSFPLGPLDFSGWLGQTLAELALREGKLDDGLVLCDRVIQRFEQQEQSGFAAGMYYWRARLHLVGEDLKQAEENALRACELLEQAENRVLLWRAEALLADTYQAQGRETPATDRRKRAQVVIEYIVAHTPSELRESFLESVRFRDPGG